jgi:hypothetical protein
MKKQKNNTENKEQSFDSKEFLKDDLDCYRYLCSRHSGGNTKDYYMFGRNMSFMMCYKCKIERGEIEE